MRKMETLDLKLPMEKFRNHINLLFFLNLDNLLCLLFCGINLQIYLSKLLTVLALRTGVVFFSTFGGSALFLNCRPSDVFKSPNTAFAKNNANTLQLSITCFLTPWPVQLRINISFMSHNFSFQAWISIKIWLTVYY